MNNNELFAREKKAAKLAAVLFKCGATAEDVINATPESWAMAAEAAGCHPPHSQATVDLVVEMLARLQSDEPEPKSAQQEADEAAAADAKAEQKWEDSQEYGENRCPVRE